MTFQLIDKKTGEVTFNGQRVNGAMPCPICKDLHKTQGWCLIDLVRGLTICPRVESTKRIGEAGWMHGESVANEVRQVIVSRQTSTPTIDFSVRWNEAMASVRTKDIEDLAEVLNLTDEIVRTVTIGMEYGNWIFPMWDDNGCCGLKIRTRDGKKLCAKGSKLGIIRSAAYKQSARTLVITEGESDLMVAAAWGFNAVARAGCQSSVNQLAAMATGKRVLIVADNDKAGKTGAERLRKAIAPKAQACFVVVPPCKDLRQWSNDGAAREDLLWRLQSIRGH